MSYNKTLILFLNIIFLSHIFAQTIPQNEKIKYFWTIRYANHTDETQKISSFGKDWRQKLRKYFNDGDNDVNKFLFQEILLYLEKIESTSKQKEVSRNIYKNIWELFLGLAKDRVLENYERHRSKTVNNSMNK